MMFRRNAGAPVATHALATAGALLLAVLTGCSTADTTHPAAPRAEPAEVRHESANLAEATTFGNIPEATVDTARQEPTDGVVLNVKRELPVYDRPGGTPFARLPASQLRAPTWVPVVDQRGDWVRVLLPSRPNGSAGWIRANDPAAVGKAQTPYRVDVDVNARRMVIRENGREIGSWTVGVGGSETPTPRGRTFIMASIEETVTHFSPIILPLGAHSETLNSYGGGPGTVALHGWPDPSVFGTASSDGCVRVPEDALQLLRSLPLGTLVLLH